MLLTLWRNSLRRWSRLIDSADGQSAARAAAFGSACASVVETLETRAMLSAGDVDVIDDDAQIMETTAALNAPLGAVVTRPVVTIVAKDAKAHETNRDVGVFTISRTGSTSKSLTVPFVIRGSAKNGLDYDKIASSVLIPAGKIAVTITIRPIDDTKVEEPETVTLVVSATDKYTIGSNGGTAQVGIRNNDGPKVSIATIDTGAGEAGDNRGVFRITRDGATDQPLDVRFTVYGKATNGIDYERIVSKMTIPAGESFINIPVKPINDIHTELSESVRIQMRIGRYLVGDQPKASLNLQDNDAVTGEGFITFSAPDGAGQPGDIFHMQARIGAIPTNLSRALDQITGSDGSDASVALSPDGQWMVLRTNRFSANGDEYHLAVYSVNDLGGGTVVALDTGPVQPLGKSVIASGGDLIVFESDEGPHESDLWAAVREEGIWSKVLMTGDSTYEVNSSPAISDDGTKILFTGGTAEGGQAILEVKTDGTGIRTVIAQDGGPEGSDAGAVMGSADYAQNDSVIFTAGWNGGSQLWKLHEGGESPTLFLFSGVTNESSASVLSSGRVITLWGDRPGNDDNALELTLRYDDGSLLATLLPGVDLPEGGIGCAG
jgi:hypothetical protein